MDFENNNGLSNSPDNEKPQEQLNTSINEENQFSPLNSTLNADDGLCENTLKKSVVEDKQAEVSDLGGEAKLEEGHSSEEGENACNNPAEQNNLQEPSACNEEEQNNNQDALASSEKTDERFTAVEEVDASEKKAKKEKSGWISTIILALICAFVAFVNFGWLYCVKVEGDSMNNTLQTGDYLAVDKLAKVERGDVIVFTGSFAGSSVKAYIKRVVAVGGDTVRISNGNLLLQKKGENGFTKVEYNGVKGETFHPGALGDIYQEYVPEGYIFVLGDNRENSKDSRIFGFIPLECVDGVVSEYVIERKDGFLGKVCEVVFKTREFVYIKILKRA